MKKLGLLSVLVSIFLFSLLFFGCTSTSNEKTTNSEKEIDKSMVDDTNSIRSSNPNQLSNLQIEKIDDKDLIIEDASSDVLLIEDSDFLLEDLGDIDVSPP